MTHHLSRRDFLCQSTGLVLAGGVAGATGAAGAAVPEHVPGRSYRRGGMLYRQLGRTDLFVSTLSFGSHTNPAFRVPGKHGGALSDEGQARRDRHIAKALNHGVNMVDVYESAGQWQPMAAMLRQGRDRALVSIHRELPQFVGRHIDDAARLFGHVDLYRTYIGDNSVNERTIEEWDVIRRAKRMGKVRAIGISTHSETTMLSALEKLEGLDYIMFPYNFIHARADYGQFLPKAIKQGVGLIAIKPLAAGSIVKLDPLARPGSTPEDPRIKLYQRTNRPLLPAVVQKLTERLNRLPGESLCQAALRFVYARPFITSAMPGMFQEHEVDDNCAAIHRHIELSLDERAVLNQAALVSRARGSAWLPRHYRWLDKRWRQA